MPLALAAPGPAKPGKWIKMFDGKTLKNWKANDNPESWKVEDGAIVSSGKRSHLFWMKQECENCEFKAEVMTKPKTNSGMYFRTAFGPGFPKGYEAQVNNSGGDPVRTGSLYNFVKILDQLAQDNVWFTQDIIADGNHIIIKVNDKVVVDEPSIVAIERSSGKIIAVGKKAIMMHGKTHENIKTIRPLRGGVIADFHAAEHMIREMIKMI